MPPKKEKRKKKNKKTIPNNKSDDKDNELIEKYEFFSDIINDKINFINRTCIYSFSYKGFYCDKNGSNQEALLDHIENTLIIIKKLKGECISQVNQINDSSNDNNDKDINNKNIIIDNPKLNQMPLIELLNTLSLSGCKLSSDG
jgi:hypothetical protein